MKNFYACLLSILILCFCLNIAHAGASEIKQPSVHGEYSINGAIHRTGGAGNKTLLRRGDFLSNELKLKIEQPLQDDWNFLTNLRLRKTPDPKIDKRKDVHLLGWTTELYNPFLRFTGGDFYGDFSQYTLSQSLRGAQAALKTDRIDGKLVAGYSQNADEGKSFRRYVFGGRSEFVLVKEQGPAKDLRMGFNFSDNEDDHNSIDNSTGVPDASNRVGSLTGHVLLWDKSDIDGEFARSWVNLDTTENSGVAHTIGSAFRLNSATKFNKQAKLRLGYESVSSGFNTLSGSAVPDKVNITSRFDYKFNQVWSLETGYRINYDKLEDSSLTKRTTTQTPRVSLNWNPESENWLLKDYESRLFWEERRRGSTDNNAGQIDYLSNDYGFENDFKVRDVNFDSGWTIRTESDDLNKENNVLANTGYIGMNMRKKFLGTTATPSLRYQLDYENFPKEEGRDLTQTVSAGLNLEITDSLRFEQRYSIETASRLAYDSDTLRLNAHLELDYKLPVKEDVTLKVRYDHIGLNHPSALNTFSEENLNTELLWKF